MSVAPDILLQPAPDVRPKASATKAPANAPEPAKNEASSFAEVYAKERQAKAADRKEAAAKARDERSDEAKPSDTAKAETPAEQPIVADSGNALPEEELADGEQEVIDPLLLLAMNGQLPVEGVSAETEPAVESTSDLLLPSSTLGTTGAPPGMTDASHDPELDMLNSLPGVRLALEIGAQNQAAAAAQQSPGAVAAEKAVSPTEGFANALAAFAGEAAPEESAEDEIPVADLLAEGLESVPELRENQSDARADAFASKLSALSQAINQQSSVAQRLPVVPGHPVPMQGAWTEAVVDRVMWLSSQNLKSAEIQLDPAELGRMEVRIEMNKDQAAQVTFISSNANVRDQLEGQMQRLRDMFSQQGMGQLDVNVSDQSLARGWQGNGDEGRRQGGSGRGGDGGDEEVLTGMSEIRNPNSAAPRGLVDYYA